MKNANRNERVQESVSGFDAVSRGRVANNCSRSCRRRNWHARKQIEYYHAERLNYAVAGTPTPLEYDRIRSH